MTAHDPAETRAIIVIARGRVTSALAVARSTLADPKRSHPDHCRRQDTFRSRRRILRTQAPVRSTRACDLRGIPTRLSGGPPESQLTRRTTLRSRHLTENTLSNAKTCAQPTRPRDPRNTAAPTTSGGAATTSQAAVRRHHHRRKIVPTARSVPAHNRHSRHRRGHRPRPRPPPAHQTWPRTHPHNTSGVILRTVRATSTPREQRRHGGATIIERPQPTRDRRPARTHDAAEISRFDAHRTCAIEPSVRPRFRPTRKSGAAGITGTRARHQHARSRDLAEITRSRTCEHVRSARSRDLGCTTTPPRASHGRRTAGQSQQRPARSQDPAEITRSDTLRTCALESNGRPRRLPS